MRRAPLVVSAIAVVLLGLIAPARTGPTTAQDATPPAGGHGFVGSWLVVGTPTQGPAVPTLLTLGADGTGVSSGPPADAPPPGAPYGAVFSSAGHGAWAATGPDTAVGTLVVQQADGAGNYLGTLTARANLMLGADGDTFSGEFVSTVADPAGNVVATIPGTMQATRIVAEGPEGPAATPAPGSAGVGFDIVPIAFGPVDAVPAPPLVLGSCA